MELYNAKHKKTMILFCIEALEARISSIKRRVNSLKKIYEEVSNYGN